MNKTVNINLANVLFHIDEKAFQKLQRYLEAIKRSFAGTMGSEEIIADIEARIAELFHEKMESDRQVVTLKEVEEVIGIMGQPEDYMVDDDLFEDKTADSPTGSGRVKKLYRDIDNKYIGGVCAGLEHYLGFDALWIRLIFIILAVFTGFGLIAYILLWILVPEAATTAQKLDMTGKPVNISSIERKVKEGFDEVADKVKSVDYEKVGDKVKSGTTSFFETLGEIIMFLFKVLGKFVGILLIIIGASTLIGLFIGLFTVGIVDIIHIPGFDLYDMVNYTDAPVWLVSFLCLFAVGIPFFFLLYLGLKILVNNLKSIGAIAKFSLLGLWLLSLIGLTVLGVKQAAAHAYSGSDTNMEELALPHAMDTLNIKLVANKLYDDFDDININGVSVAYNEAGDKLLYSDDVRVDIKKSEDSISRIRIRKDANGNSFADARDRASKITYSYEADSTGLSLDDHLTTAMENKFRDQEVRLTVYVPAGMVLTFNDNARGHIGRTTKYDADVYRRRMVQYTWLMGESGKLLCQDCPEEIKDDSEGHIIIDGDGIDIDIRDSDEGVIMKIDEEGVKIKKE
ncbi:MAG: PspC domain-containing protein [Flavobacteriaceae bacterium]|nr:PspC domain-containing protein [Flavobacteriaceae bacterium]MDH3796323.1 PspC domain-containing protein [Flavobacteriaceae bacterium]